jgi:pilus assembly protein Flp/PilA
MGPDTADGILFGDHVRIADFEAGATATEYGLIAALIAVAAIAALQLVGTNLTSAFNTIASKV